MRFLRKLWAPIFVLVFFALATLARAKEPVDLNQASIEELMSLPSIGESRAQTIVTYRSKHPFKRPADLLKIKGIGRKTYAKLQPLVRVGSGAKPTTNMQ